MGFLARRSVYWRWVGIGIGATILGILVVPAYNWEGQPVRSWLSFTLFPYGTIISDYPVYELHPRFRPLLMWGRVVFWLGQFPLYGLLLAVASRREKLRLWSYTLLIVHILSACIAGAMFYRWIVWRDETFIGFIGRVSLSMAFAVAIGLSTAWLVCRFYRTTRDEKIHT